MGARRPTHATGARVSSVAGASGNPFASRGARGALRERRVLFITEFLCSLRGGWRGWGFPSSARAGARLGRGVGLGLRERKLFFVSIILRDKDVFSLAAIILKKFCDKKNTTLSLTQNLQDEKSHEEKAPGPHHRVRVCGLHAFFAVALTKDLYAPNCARSFSFNGLKEFDRSDRSRKREQERAMGGVPKTICEASTSSGVGARARLLQRRSFLLEPRPSSSRRRREREREIEQQQQNEVIE